MFESGKRVHIVGIGGSGLSAIARVLLQRGVFVSGSDRGNNALTAQLAQEGALIHVGHDAAHIGDADLLLVSSAIQADNPELTAARQQGIPVYKRQELLKPLLAGYRTLAVAGTHGKTTTTAMLTHLLRTTGYDPSYIVGGIMINTGDNAHQGSDDLFVIEADEYDNMFHGLTPITAILTSLEYDHPDFFITPEVMIDSFSRFVAGLDDGSTLIVCADNAALTLADSRLNMQTYGQTNGIYQVADVRYHDDLMTFMVTQNGQPVTTVRLGVFGRHNALNALAAALAAQTVGVSLSDGLAALATFQGTGRRFDVRGEVNGVIVVDDYAHHPTAIATTLDAVAHRYPQHELWAVWQPHTFSRTQQLLADYASSFDEADHVLVTDIYAAREPFTDAINSQRVALRIQHQDARASGDLMQTAALLLAEVRSPAVILIMSAGDAPQIGVEVLAELSARP